MKRKLFVFAVMFNASAFHLRADSGLTLYNRQIVAACLVLEAGGEGPAGMQAVLNVILNRADGCLHRVMQETIKYGAFSCMSSIWNCRAPDYSPLLGRALNQPDPYNEALQLIATMERGLLPDNTGGATHYHTHSIRPYWASRMRYLITIGRHHFYVERESQIASR
jgi:spore germination cell wall hydrolase CwlJ-like protein